MEKQILKYLLISGCFVNNRISVIALKILAVIILFSIAFNASAQFAWSGKIIDSISYEPLPFVTIIINHSNNTGTRTDMDGKFQIISNSPVLHLTVSYVGYKTKEVDITANSKQTEITILLHSSEQQLEDVTVYAGENPADIIIKKAINRSAVNDPDNLAGYSYKTYNKYVFTADTAFTVSSRNRKDNDTLKQVFDYLKGSYLMIMESVIETYYKKPSLKKELVVASKVSGFKNPSFALASTQLQPFTFYTQYITLADVDYLNPVSKGSDNFYFFSIEDSSFQGTDTIYHISFKPRKGKNLLSLKGMLFITSDGFAIQHVTAEPFDTAGMAMIIKIEQDYYKPDSTHWFPLRYNTNIHYNNFLKPGLKVYMQGRSYIDSIEINPRLNTNLFDGVAQQMDVDAGFKNDAYWHDVRPDTLSGKEIFTYSRMDSIGKESHMDSKLNIINGILGSEFPIGFVSIDLANIIKINGKENYRFGLGLTTNNKASRLLKASAYAGFGINDNTWKYGGQLMLKLNNRLDYSLLFHYSHDYEETGGVNFYKDNFFGNTQKFRNTLVDRFDMTDRYEISLSGRIIRFLNFRISGFHTERTPAFDYFYLNSFYAEPIPQPFLFSGIVFSGRFAWKEKIVKSFGQNFYVNNPWPVIWFNVTHGMDILKGGFNYWKADFKFTFEFPTRRLGTTYLQGFAGSASAALPLSELYSCKGNYTRYGLYSFSNFQTMRANEFYYSTFAALFWEQDLGSLIFKAGKFRPKLLLSTSICSGKLNDPFLHLLNGKEINKEWNNQLGIPYTESGIILNNLISKKIWGVLRLGVGVGGYYRWGHYTLSKISENMALKLAFYIAG